MECSASESDISGKIIGSAGIRRVGVDVRRSGSDRSDEISVE